MASTESPHVGSRRMLFSAPRTAKSAFCAADSAEVNPVATVEWLASFGTRSPARWLQRPMVGTVPHFRSYKFYWGTPSQPQTKNQTRALVGLRRFILWYLRFTSDTDVWIQTIAAKGKTTPCSSAVRILRRTRPRILYRIPMSCSAEPSRRRQDWDGLRLREAGPQSTADRPALP